MAIKATYTERDGKGFNITKDPITDDGTKKSATGLLSVVEIKGAHETSLPILKQECTWEEVFSPENLLEKVFINGHKYFTDSWEEITKRAKNNVNKLEFYV